MATFTIDCDNNITAFASRKETQAADIAGAEYFGSQEELAKLATAWPGSRLVEIWNSLPGVVSVKKFTDRKTALARIWKAAQALTPPGAPQGAQDAPKAAQATKKAARRQKGAPAREDGQQAHQGSKKAQVLETAAPARGRHARRDQEGHRLAGARDSRLHQRGLGEEDGPQGRVL